MYANTLAVVEPARGGPAIDVVAREYGLPRDDVVELARLNDTHAEPRARRRGARRGSTSCSTAADDDGRRRRARRPRARAARRHAPVRARRRPHQPDVVGGAAARHPHRRRSPRGGRDALRRRLGARDRRAGRRARHRRTRAHQRAHRHRDRARAAVADGRDRGRGDVARRRQRRGRDPRPARGGAAGHASGRGACTTSTASPSTSSTRGTDATTGTPGPVYLEIAIDLIHSHDRRRDRRVAGAPRARRDRGASRRAELVDRAAALLRGARTARDRRRQRRVVGGRGRRAARARRARHSGRDPPSRRAARSPTIIPLCFGRDWQNVVFQADVLLVVGKQLDYFFGYGRFPHLAHLVQVDVEPGEIGRNRVPVSVGIVADAKPDARRARGRGAAARHRRVGRAAARAGRRRSRPPRPRSRARTRRPIHPMRLCAEVQARLDAGHDRRRRRVEHAHVDRRDVPRVRSRVASRAWATSGRSATACVTRSRAGSPGRDRKPVWMVGDGSFGFNAMELDTAARHGVPIVTDHHEQPRVERGLGTARRAPLRAHGRRVRRRGLLRRARPTRSAPRSTPRSRRHARRSST